MARYFSHEAVIVKEVKRTGLKIIFYNRESIYIYNSTNGWTVFHRWFAPRGSYKGWVRFRELLLREKNVDYNHCFKLAFQRDIPSQSVAKGPDLSSFKVEERIVV